jgi:hypothetical protein
LKPRVKGFLVIEARIAKILSEYLGRGIPGALHLVSNKLFPLIDLVLSPVYAFDNESLVALTPELPLNAFSFTQTVL